MTPLEFLNALWRDKPDEQFVLIWTLKDKRSRWFTDVEQAAGYVESVSGKDDVYLGVGLAGKDYGPSKRCVSTEITGIAGIGCDFDLASDAHQKKALPRTVDDALSILPATMLPTIVVHTGNGAHGWWLLKEPHVFEDDADRQHVQSIVERWHLMLSLRAAAKGWAYDRLSDFARILRIPGTTNHKEPANPKPVTVLAHDGERRYNLADLEEFLDDAAIPNLEAQERAAQVWADKFKDVPLTIDLNAKIPQDLLDLWMDPKQSADPQIAMRFRNTWLRQRHDLRDQSQSGYDLALADFGVMAGLSEQQIVDLIVYHRTIHHQRQRNTIDYFQRTITKAFSRNPDAPGPRVEVQPPGAVEPSQVTPSPAAATAHAEPEKAMSIEDQKAALCEQISKALAIGSASGAPIRITRLVKVTGKDPSFRMELDEGTKIEFPNITKFVDQNFVRLAIAAQVNKMMPKIKPRDWDRLKDEMLAACFEEQGPIEAQWEESARDIVCRYLEDNQVQRSLEDAPQPQYRMLPVLMEGRIAINTTHFQSWVNRTTFQNLAVKAIASMLSAMGAEQRTVYVRRGVKQSRWTLPIDHFDPADYVQAEMEVEQEA